MTTIVIAAVMFLMGYCAARTMEPTRPVIVLARRSEQPVVELANGIRERHSWTSEQVAALLDQRNALQRALSMAVDRLRDERMERREWHGGLN